MAEPTTQRLPTIEDDINGVHVSLMSHPTLFSPRRIDAGTRAMLETAAISMEDKVLDLGCGYGVVGIVAAKLIGKNHRVFLLDKDPQAVAVSLDNAARNAAPAVEGIVSDGFRDCTEAGFTLILCNPPYHADFAVPKHFIEKGFNRLVVGGRMLMVTKRRDWYRNKLRAIFGNVKLHDHGGHTVFEAVKQSPEYAKATRAKPKQPQAPRR